MRGFAYILFGIIYTAPKFADKEMGKRGFCSPSFFASFQSEYRDIYYAKYYCRGGTAAGGKKNKEDLGGKNEKGERKLRKII